MELVIDDLADLDPSKSGNMYATFFLISERRFSRSRSSLINFGKFRNALKAFFLILL